MCNKCVDCGEPILPKARRKLGYTTCLTCGDKHAKLVNHCVVPMAKSNYIHVRDLQLLKQLNKYANL